MERRKAITALFSVPIVGVNALEILDEDADHVNVENNTAVTAIRINGKLYALGIRLVPGDPNENTKLFTELARVFKRTGLDIAPFI